MMRRRVAQARVGRLATVDPHGRPHIVPVCFALERERIISVVDHKPKATTELRRVTNIRANPAVSLIVDHYDEDWEQLWWVRVDGRARIVSLVDDRDILDPLFEKYRGQYGLHPPPGPAIVMSADRWVGWSAR
jgi:PPOX class probable F420-dependent enzyme